MVSRHRRCHPIQHHFLSSEFKNPMTDIGFWRGLERESDTLQRFISLHHFPNSSRWQQCTFCPFDLVMLRNGSFERPLKCVLEELFNSFWKKGNRRFLLAFLQIYRLKFVHYNSFSTVAAWKQAPLSSAPNVKRALSRGESRLHKRRPSLRHE